MNLIIKDYENSSVKVVEHGPLYRAQLTISLLERDYHTQFMGRQRIVTAWGRSVESAAARARRKARRIAKADQELYEDRKKRTQYV